MTFEPAMETPLRIQQYSLLLFERIDSPRLEPDRIGQTLGILKLTRDAAEADFEHLPATCNRTIRLPQQTWFEASPRQRWLLATCICMGSTAKVPSTTGADVAFHKHRETSRKNGCRPIIVAK
ncbi:hypothetical protein IF2G_04984 [Cordyceps javanica]|nr:hypothetical protein IF2G_04984 [Cordyceps javanica]